MLTHILDEGQPSIAHVKRHRHVAANHANPRDDHEYRGFAGTPHGKTTSGNHGAVPIFFSGCPSWP